MFTKLRGLECLVYRLIKIIICLANQGIRFTVALYLTHIKTILENDLDSLKPWAVDSDLIM